MHKNVYFLEKTVKSPQRWELRPRILIGKLPDPCLRIQIFKVRFWRYTHFITSKNKTEATNSKCSTFASSALCPYFHFKLCNFFGGGAKYYLPPGAGTHATPLVNPPTKVRSSACSYKYNNS